MKFIIKIIKCPNTKKNKYYNESNKILTSVIRNLIEQNHNALRTTKYLNTLTAMGKIYSDSHTQQIIVATSDPNCR